MGANGRLLADGASPPKRKTSSKRDDSAAEAELVPLLKSSEEIRECLKCGVQFVSVGDEYCSHLRCQLEARRLSS
jgi:hypothetical protein